MLLSVLTSFAFEVDLVILVIHSIAAAIDMNSLLIVQYDLRYRAPARVPYSGQLAGVRTAFTVTNEHIYRRCVH